MHPIDANFAVESYYCVHSQHCCAVTFCGIYTNAQLAVYAFKVATERITQMMAGFTPETRPGSVNTRSASLSYALGIVAGIDDAVQADLKREELQRREKLRLAASRGEAYEESDDEDSDAGPGFSIAGNSTEDHTPPDLPSEDHAIYPSEAPVDA